MREFLVIRLVQNINIPIDVYVSLSCFLATSQKKGTISRGRMRDMTGLKKRVSEEPSPVFELIIG